MFTYTLEPFVAVRPQGPITKSRILYLPNSDEIDLLIKAARVAPVEHSEEVEPGALEYVIDCASFKMTPWEILADCWDEIMERPGSGMAFKELLYSAEYWRQECGDASGVVLAKIHQMIERLIASAQERLDIYNALTNEEKKARQEQGDKIDRPADIYRDLAPALQYATRELGHLAARQMYKHLMLVTTMPFNELENPDWIDPYTGDGDKKYEQIRIRTVETAAAEDGEIPLMVADLLESMSSSTRYGGLSSDGKWVAEEAGTAPLDDKEFTKQFGQSMEDFYRLAIEAQRGGFNPIADAGEAHVEVEFDVIEKDFEFKEDYETTAELEALRAIYAQELRALDNEIKTQSAALVILRRQPKRVAWAKRWIAPMVRHSDAYKRLFKMIKAVAHKYEPQDLLALILPFQNELCFRLEDLEQIQIPGQWGNLSRWYENYGDAFLSQFQDQAGIMEAEPVGDELDEFVEDMIEERTRVYLSPKGNQIYKQVYERMPGKRAAKKAAAQKAFDLERSMSIIGLAYNPLKNPLPIIKWNRTFADTNSQSKAWAVFWEEVADDGKHNALFTPEFVEAEVRASIMGDGSQMSAFKSGWDAWRQKVSPAGNLAYHKALSEGKTSKQAMTVFWDVYNGPKNTIASVNPKGLVMGNGRQIDWGLAKLKIEKGEIKLTPEEMKHLFEMLQERKWGAYLQGYLFKQLKALEALACEQAVKVIA